MWLHSSSPLALGCELRFYGNKEGDEYRRDRYFEYQQVACISSLTRWLVLRSIRGTQVPALGVVHRGDNEHEVLPMTSQGHRYNLIMWLSY
jgi:hypothetical protein